MRTGSFFTTVGLPGRVSIARWAPKGFRDLPRISALAPGAWFKSVDIPTYEKLYAQQLADLNPGSIWNELHALADDHEPVILCWERRGQFCHRRLIAEWIGEKLGEVIVEYGVQSDWPA